MLNSHRARRSDNGSPGAIRCYANVEKHAFAATTRCSICVRRNSSAFRERRSWYLTPGGVSIGGVAAPVEGDLGAARVARVLARAVRKVEVEAVDALRILRHELCRRNTNSTPRIKVRSVGAQGQHRQVRAAETAEERLRRRPARRPRLSLRAEVLHSVDTVEGWVAELARLRTVVCVATVENPGIPVRSRTAGR